MINKLMLGTDRLLGGFEKYRLKTLALMERQDKAIEKRLDKQTTIKDEIATIETDRAIASSFLDSINAFRNKLGITNKE